MYCSIYSDHLNTIFETHLAVSSRDWLHVLFDFGSICDLVRAMGALMHDMHSRQTISDEIAMLLHH